MKKYLIFFSKKKAVLFEEVIKGFSRSLCWEEDISAGCTEPKVTGRGSCPGQPASRCKPLSISCSVSPPRLVLFASTISACLHVLASRLSTLPLLAGSFAGRRMASVFHRLLTLRLYSSPRAYLGGW